MGETFLISFIERILRVGAEFTIVWRIKKDEVSSFRRMFLKERFKVHVLYHSISKMLLQLRGLHISNLSCQIFSVIRDATVRNVELTPAVISKHRSVGILPHKKEDGCRRTWRNSISICIVVKVPQMHIEGTFKGALNIRHDITIWQFPFFVFQLLHTGCLTHKIPLNFSYEVLATPIKEFRKHAIKFFCMALDEFNNFLPHLANRELVRRVCLVHAHKVYGVSIHKLAHVSPLIKEAAKGLEDPWVVFGNHSIQTD